MERSGNPQLGRKGRRDVMHQRPRCCASAVALDMKEGAWMLLDMRDQPGCT